MEVKIPAYLKQSNLYNLETTLANREGDLYEFEDSIFHLQGGGQPNDKGWIVFEDKKFDILGGNIHRESGRLLYKLPAEAEALPIGSKVNMSIDGALRELHAKIHSAGHLIDLAVQRLKYGWETTKGYHFVDGPYVQYKGTLQNAQKVMGEINTEVNHIIEQKIQTKSKVFGWNQAVGLKLIPETFKTSFVRVVAYQNSECPCGGTHIQNTSDMKQLVITKVSKKGKNIKVYYRVA